MTIIAIAVTTVSLLLRGITGLGRRGCEVCGLLELGRNRRLHILGTRTLHKLSRGLTILHRLAILRNRLPVLRHRLPVLRVLRLCVLRLTVPRSLLVLISTPQRGRQKESACQIIR